MSKLYDRDINVYDKFKTAGLYALRRVEKAHEWTGTVTGGKM